MRSSGSVIRAGRIVFTGLATLFVFAACGDGGTGPEVRGSVRAYIHDAPDSTASGTSAPSRAGSGSYSGSIFADARVEIASEGGAWVELGPPTSAAVDLQASGNRVDLHGRALVPVGTYTRVRLVLTDARARLNTGSTIGGITLTASVTMTLGTGGTVVIEKSVPPFQIRADTHTSISWDVGSELWVNEANAQDEQVDEPEVEEAAEPHVQEEPGDGQMM